MKRAVIFPLVAVLLLSACSVKKHAVISTEQQTSDFRLQTSLQTKVLFDSLLHTVDFSADSVTILVTPSAPPLTSECVPGTSVVPTAMAGAPSIKITAHNPKVSSTKKENNLAVVQTAEQDSAASSAHANSHADNSKEVVGVASPMNGTVVTVIVLLAVLLIATIVLLLFLHKYKII